MTGDDEPVAPEQPETEAAEVEGADNAADPRAPRRKAERKRHFDKEGQRFWTGVLADPIGRREIWGMLNSAHCFEERFAVGPTGFPQPESTWFQAGEQAFALRLFLSLQHIDRDGVFLMLDEFDPRFAKPAKPKKGNV